MNLHELFRSFMGFPSTPRSDVPPTGHVDENGDWNPYDGSFADPRGMMKHLDEVFRNFGLTEFPPLPHVPHGPALEGPEEPLDLRDRMLKVPDYTEPFSWGSPMGPQFAPGPSQEMETPFRDTDLDAHVAASGIDSLLAPSEEALLPQQRSWGSSSVHTFTSVNGKVEEKTVVTDPEGRQEVTVRRSLGDRSHTLMTRIRPDGAVDTEEHFVNMDEEDKAKFEDMWNKASSPEVCEIVPFTRGGDASYGSIFQKLFGFAPPPRP